MSTDLTTHSPFKNFSAIRERFDRFLAERTGGRLPDGTWPMAMDIQRTPENVILRADVPGMKPEEIAITVENGVLTVTGTHEEESETTEGGYTRRERRYGAFRRSMALPPEAEPDHIEATTKDGVLEVKVPVGEAEVGNKITITPTAG